jgi:hypothetical protein
LKKTFDEQSIEKDEAAVRKLQDDANKLGIDALLEEIPKLELSSDCANAMKMWEDLGLKDKLQVANETIDKISGDDESIPAMKKLLEVMEGNVANSVDDAFSRLNDINGKVAQESNVRTVVSFIKDIYESVTI